MPNLRLCWPRSFVALTENYAIRRAFLKLRERPTVAKLAGEYRPVFWACIMS